jgi:hypothetical protein
VFKDKGPIKKYVVSWEEKQSTTFFYQDYIGNTSRRPIAKSDFERKSIMEYKLGRIVKI